MARLVLLPRHRLAVERHAAATYPEECCGVLMGRPLGGGGGSLVERVRPVDNARADSRGNRYLLHPETVLAAEKEARRLGLRVVGYYHSHPDHPSRPSEFDREHAWPGLSYVIVSVRDGEVADARSWRLTDDRERFEQEELTSEVPLPVAIRRAAAGSARTQGLAKEER
jgi:proteasome lid subunit RPN8/RPN11